MDDFLGHAKPMLLSGVLHGESLKRLKPPRNTKDRKHKVGHHAKPKRASATSPLRTGVDMCKTAVVAGNTYNLHKRPPIGTTHRPSTRQHRKCSPRVESHNTNNHRSLGLLLSGLIYQACMHAYTSPPLTTATPPNPPPNSRTSTPQLEHRHSCYLCPTYPCSPQPSYAAAQVEFIEAT